MKTDPFPANSNRILNIPLQRVMLSRVLTVILRDYPTFMRSVLTETDGFSI